MSFSDAELEEKLKDAGRSLLGLPSTTDEILSLLDGIEELLVKVAQSPSKSVQDALYSVMRGLISYDLLRHSDMDVKVSAVSCIAEITRITAPDQPYGDDNMKEVFQVTIAAFEKLSQLSGRCYTKVTAILDVIAKVRACLLMLDLECDALVFEMFQHFLNHIRSDHPDNVFSSMEVIMTMVLEESEDIPLDIISLLLGSVKKENQDISPISRKLGESVITNCASTLKPYLTEAVKLLGINVDDYAQIVASICEKAKEDLENKSASDAKDNLENENKLVNNVDLNEPLQETKGLASDIVVTRKTGQTADGTSKSTCNGILSARKDDSPSQKPKFHILIKHSRRADSTSVAESDTSLSLKADKTKSEPDSVQKPNSSAKTEEEGNPGRDDSRGTAELNGSSSIKEYETEIKPDSVPTKRALKRNSSKNRKGDSAPDSSLSVKADKSENEPESLPKKRGRKPNSLMNPEEGYDHSWMWSERKTYGPTRSRKSREKGSVSSPSGNTVLKKATSPSTLENVAEPAGLQSERNETGVHSPRKGHSIPDETYRRRGILKRKGAILSEEANPKSLSMVKGELLSAEVEEKTPKKEPEDTIPPDEKEPGNSTRLGLSAKTNDGAAVASAEMDDKELDNLEKLGLSAETTDKTAVTSAEMEAEDPSNPEEKLLQSTMKLLAENVNEDSSVKSGPKKRKRVNNSANKDISEGSVLKKTSFETGTKSPDGDGSDFRNRGKSILRKNRVIGKEEESQSPEFGELMVGRRIKVWWPLDKQYYKGVIASYDPCKKRHKVCYDDGEQEILNMKKQQWETITDDDEKADLPSVDTSSAITPKLEKKNTKSRQKKQANDASSSQSNPQKRRQNTKSNQKSQVKRPNQEEEEEEEEKADNSPESNLQRGRGKAKPDQEKQTKCSGQAKQAKARSSSTSTPRGRKGKTKSDEGTEAKNSNEEKQAKAESFPKSNAQKKKLKIKSDEGKQAEKSDGLNLVKADSSSKSNPGKGKPQRKSDEGTQAEKSGEPKPVKADSSLKGKQKLGKLKRRSAEEKQAKKPDEPKAQADSSSESNPPKGIQKKKPNGEKQAEKSDEPNPVKADSSLKGKPKLGKRKQKSDEEKQAEKPDEPKAQADPSPESNPQKGIQKKKPDGEKQAEKADESKQAKADTPAKRIEPNTKLIRSGAKSADPCPAGNPATKDELVADKTKMVDKLKDDGQVSAGDAEAGELKTTSACKKASPETRTSSEGKCPKADTGVDDQQCTNEVVEMHKGEE